MPLSTVAAPRQPLPPVVAEVDRVLARIDAQVDWLRLVSPIHDDSLWEAFERSGRERAPPLRYPDVDIDLHGLRESLMRLPIEEIESPSLESLLSEKQRELDRQIELVRLRGKDGFVQASIDLFGDVPVGLKKLALRILENVEPGDTLEHDAGLADVLAAAEAELAYYRSIDEDFRCEVIVDPGLGSLLMVSQGNLHIQEGIRIPRARVDPLMQHEIGTHVVTRHNGSRQPLSQLAVGLAHYDALQEGLGVLSEYLAGFLPPQRLRVLAGRVLAADMVVDGEDVPAIFACLHGEHGLPEDDAFDTALRAVRGGGLTKDAVYLAGLRDLLDYLGEGGRFEDLFLGKFALSQLSTLKRLAAQGWVAGGGMLPRYWPSADAVRRLEACRSGDVAELYDRQVQG